jgi:DNA/RNA-binding domain of Phe-tRNA-synthetase-like protein
MGFALAEGVRATPSDDGLLAAIDDAVKLAGSQPWPPEEIRTAIRDLLRVGGFKPTGRSKPASEYLAKASESFPRINNLVDVNNLVSLRTGWPCSIIDLDLACPTGTESLEVRFGSKDEAYVFNSAGQSIDVSGLLCLARVGGEPIANAVKDSMSTKTRDSSTRVLLVTYTSRRVAAEADVLAALARVEELLRRHAGATSTESFCLAQPGG